MTLTKLKTGSTYKYNWACNTMKLKYRGFNSVYEATKDYIRCLQHYKTNSFSRAVLPVVEFKPVELVDTKVIYVDFTKKSKVQ